ncbi:archaeal ATPase, fused to C-terminal DUF234 domain protein [Lachnospiraceae bacterium TWA4]|nr:archaeal ATPase, fused to C-terminal DUF234 domain protein [Lachnospiraceae bacterium TWA4]
MGQIFEDICMQYLWKLLLTGKSPVDFVDLGRWWGNDPTTRSQTEIDIMGEQDKKTALFGECKWKNDLVDIDVLETLTHRSKLFHYEKVHLFLFSKTGFTQSCIENSKKLGNISLVTYADIVKELETN